MKRPLLTLALVLAVFVVAFWLAGQAQESQALQDIVVSYGYFGVFVVSLVTGFNLLVPIPAISFLPLLLASGLNLWLTLITMTLGMTIADGLAHIFGRASRSVISESCQRFIRRLDALHSRNPRLIYIVMFSYASIVPLPNELLLIPLGLMGYRLRGLLLFVFLGNGIFNLLGAFGVTNVFNALFV